jgi:putative component of membrane protein insertase Oxa1/YidC/SpoIIIJ protein YidD
MRILILVMIGVYRRVYYLLPRRNCLFAESCAVHVERVTRTEGSRAGVRALVHRMRACRPGGRIRVGRITEAVSAASASQLMSSLAARAAVREDVPEEARYAQSSPITQVRPIWRTSKEIKSGQKV